MYLHISFLISADFNLFSPLFAFDSFSKRNASHWFFLWFTLPFLLFLLFFLKLQKNSSGFSAEYSQMSCERREPCTLISEANISPDDTNKCLQMETDHISSKSMKAAMSFCFASIFLGQTKTSLDQVPVGPLLVFWPIPRLPSIGILVVLVPGSDSIGGRILCRKNNKKFAFSISIIFSLYFRHQITEWPPLTPLPPCPQFQTP